MIITTTDPTSLCASSDIIIDTNYKLKGLTFLILHYDSLFNSLVDSSCKNNLQLQSNSLDLKVLHENIVRYLNNGYDIPRFKYGIVKDSRFENTELFKNEFLSTVKSVNDSDQKKSIITLGILMRSDLFESAKESLSLDPDPSLIQAQYQKGQSEDRIISNRIKSVNIKSYNITIIDDYKFPMNKWFIDILKNLNEYPVIGLVGLKPVAHASNAESDKSLYNEKIQHLAELTTFTVQPEFSRSGYGSILLSLIEKHASEDLKIRKMVGRIIKEHEVLPFYEKQSYKIINSVIIKSQLQPVELSDKDANETKKRIIPALKDFTLVDVEKLL